MDIEEFAATMNQLVRERKALNGAYVEIQERMDAQADEAAVSGKRSAGEAVPELAQLVMQLRNFVSMEREHGDKLFALLIDTMGLLAEVYEIELPHGWTPRLPSSE